MSVFHALVVGKGTYPFRFALSPVLICPQAEGLVAELIVSPSVTDALCLGADASVTVNLTCVVPAALCAGVPVIAPVDALIDRPLGSPLALNAYGVVPPLAARL